MDTAQKRDFVTGPDASEAFSILTRLRRSGFVHMQTAAPLLMDELGLSESAASRLIAQWQRRQEEPRRAPLLQAAASKAVWARWPLET
jgi:hypothetical protein